MVTTVDSLRSLSQSNVEAALKTFNTVSKGVQTVASEIVGFNKMSLERQADLMRALAAAKNPGEALEIQGKFWRSSYTELATEMSKLGDLWTSIAREATQQYETAANVPVPMPVTEQQH